MSVVGAVALVEERKMSRNWSPVFRSAGIRLQSEGTSVGGAATSSDLDRVGGGPAQAAVGPFEMTVAERGVAEGELRAVDDERVGIRVEDRFAWRVKIYAQTGGGSDG